DYVRSMPGFEEHPIYNYNNYHNAFDAKSGFVATKPVSLLYRKEVDRMVLVGAMYNASPAAAESDLDARLPLSIAHWHEHVDFCGPSPESVRAGTAKTDPSSVAAWLRIRTKEDCDKAGGRVTPPMFGSIAHVDL